MRKKILFFIPVFLLSSCSFSTRSLFLEKGKEEIPVDTSNILRLDMEALPSRTMYFEGEKFDPSGIEIFAVTKNGDDIELDPTELIVPSEPLVQGQESIKIGYEDKTVEIPINVKKGKKYEFEVEEGQIFGKTAVLTDNSASGTKYLGQMSGYKGSGFSFNFNSTISTYATVSFVMKGNTTAYDFGKNVEIQTVSSEGISKLTFSKEIEVLNEWSEITTCSITVGEGINKILLINNGGVSSNIDKIVFTTDAVIVKSNADITSSAVKIECEDMSPYGNCIPDFEPGSNNPSGGKYIGAVNQTKGAGVRFIVKAERTTSALLEMSIGRQASNWYDFDFFPSHKVGVEYSDGTKPIETSTGLAKIYKSSAKSWFDWVKTPICEVSLRQGYNVVKIENATGGYSGNWDYVVLTPIFADAGLKFYPISRFECEDGNLIGTKSNQTYTSITSGITPASSNNPSGLGYVGGIDSNKDSGYSYEVNAEKDCTADLLICLGLSEHNYSFNSNHKISVEHQDGSSDDILFNNVNIMSTSTNKWFDWKLFNIGKVTLKSGKNTVKVIHTTTSRSANHDYFMLASDAKIESNVVKKYRFEAENATLTGTSTKVMDDSKGSSGGGFVTGCKSSSTIKFTINSTRNCTINLNICVGNKSSAIFVPDYYTFGMSNSKVSKNVSPKFHFYAASDKTKVNYEWAEYIIGELQLIAGSNTFTITAKKSSDHFVDYIDIYSSGVLS